MYRNVWPFLNFLCFFVALCGSDSTGSGIRGPQLQGERSEWRSIWFLSSVSSCHTHSIPSSLQITGVSILRAGETMEPALRAVCKDVRIGKILIQTNLDSGEPEVAKASTQPNLFRIQQSVSKWPPPLFFKNPPPRDSCLRGNYLSCACNRGNCSPPLWPGQLHYLRLPKDITEDHVILMDSTVSTGAAAMMAVRVLLVGGDKLCPSPSFRQQ